MVDEDDLLDDMAELDEQNRDEVMEDGRIEAISQLSPERPSSTTNGTGAMTSKAAPQEVEKGEQRENNNRKKDQKNTQTLQQITTLGKRRGARSPDLKGVSASRKLASRGRLSPRKKVLKPVRETMLDSQRIPRHEVYPSAIKSRKSVSKFGSVVSQKPSSSQI